MKKCSTISCYKKILLGGTILFGMVSFGNISVANDKDISAAQSAMIYDLLSSLDKTKLPSYVDKKIFKDAVNILKKEKIYTITGRPNFKESGLLDKYSKAMFMGNRGKKFAPEIAKIHDIAVSGNEPALRKSLAELWEKAGRKRPNDKALDPVVKSIYNAKKAQPQETINYVVEKKDHKIEIKHSVAGGRMKIAVETMNADGSVKERTVFQGTTITKPTKNGRNLERKIKLDQICTNTEESDKEVFEKLVGKWKTDSSSGAWVLSGSASNYVFTNNEPNGITHRYKGSLSRGKLYGSHLITKAGDIGGNTLPASVRSQIAAMGNVTFRIYLEVCGNDISKLSGTWSSQHVTYDGMSFKVSRIHDPYDLSLTLARETNMKSAQGAYEKEWP